jgi:hypothetical protein
MRLLSLADVTRKWAQPYGITVIEEAGWQSRGKEFPAAGPDVAVRHWTAGSATGIWPSGKILTLGRSDLPGPLCQLSQDRRPAGTLDCIRVVASGVANHAGLGDWNGTSGANSVTVGLEIEWSGPNEHFSQQRILVSEIAMRALMDFCGKNPDDACEHREWANPPGRKIDTNLDGNVLRRRMAQLAQTPAPTPTPTPTPEEDDDMGQPYFFARLDGDATVWLVTENQDDRHHVPSQEVLGVHQFFLAMGNPAWNKEVVVCNTPALKAWLNSIPANAQRREEWGTYLNGILATLGAKVGLPVDIDALAAKLGPLIKAGATKEEIAKAVVAEIAS